MSLRLLQRVLDTTLSQEDILDGKVWEEIEKVWYVRITNTDQLMQAAKWEYQIQNDIKLSFDKRNGILRVRDTRMGTATRQVGESIFSLIAKVKQDASGVSHNKEAAVPTSADFFLLLSQLAPTGMRKDRYTFPVEGTDLNFEVDMFLTPEAIEARQTGRELMGPTYWPWAKIDLELPSENTPIPPLPIEVEETILQTEEDNPNITKLYDEYFITQNA